MSTWHICEPVPLKHNSLLVSLLVVARGEFLA